MKHILLWTVSLLLLGTFSCKKNEQKTAPAVLKTIEQSPSGITTTFAYDASGRLTSSSKNDGTKTMIVYSGDTITETYYLSDGTVAGAKLLTTDSFGLATGYITLDSSGSVSGFGSYTYDGAGHRVSESIYNASNNPIQKRDWGYDAAGDLSSYDVYDTIIPANNEQYYYDKYYVSQINTTDYPNQGQSYYGIQSHNLIKAMHRYNPVLGNIIYYYTYTFDEYGRTTSITAKDHNGVLKYTNTYTYN